MYIVKFRIKYIDGQESALCTLKIKYLNYDEIYKQLSDFKIDINKIYRLKIIERKEI